MSFTRFNYDTCRTAKLLQESTGPGRYMLNVPGWGSKPCFFDDPQIRMQEWGANLRKVSGGAPIDIDTDLKGITRPLSNCPSKQYQFHMNVDTKKVRYPTCAKPVTDESRATHQAWMYRDLEQNHRYILFLNPQENTCMPFQNNLNTRILEKDYFVSQAPCLLRQRGRPIGVYEGKNKPSATLKQ